MIPMFYGSNSKMTKGYKDANGYYLLFLLYFMEELVAALINLLKLMNVCLGIKGIVFYFQASQGFSGGVLQIFFQLNHIKIIFFLDRAIFSHSKFILIDCFNNFHHRI
jgi:hypothetical protein